MSSSWLFHESFTVTHHELHGDVILVTCPIHLNAGPDAHRGHRDVADDERFRSAHQVQHVQVSIWDALKQGHHLEHNVEG